MDQTLSYRRSINFKLGRLVVIAVGIGLALVAGVVVGRFIIVADTNDLFERFRALMLTSLTGAALAMAIGLMISIRLQRSITSPLVALTRTMTAIRQSHDYAAAVEVASDDEIGVLASSFNGMIGEIRERDHRLEKHRENLEQ